MAGREYYTLMASLPALPYFERASRLPINEVRLRKRLEMLEDDDRAVTRKLIEFLAWKQQPLERTDREVVTLYEQMERLTRHLPGAWSMIVKEISQRTIMAALRRRKKGQGPPGKWETWGVGPWVEHIELHWNNPDFMMGFTFPWIPKARSLLEGGEALELSRLLFKENWDTADGLSWDDPFSFEAVLAYISKWAIISVWLGYDNQAAEKRFNSLIMEVTHGQEQLFSIG
ncbi:MAG: DUF2764 family protein [Candidatus Eremiobacteraeota bacterium]|nr:DUF2764 family protein [Candidatus Eremiobacteraeota bacterium]